MTAAKSCVGCVGLVAAMAVRAGARIGTGTRALGSDDTSSWVNLHPVDPGIGSGLLEAARLLAGPGLDGPCCRVELKHRRVVKLRGLAGSVLRAGIGGPLARHIAPIEPGPEVAPKLGGLW